MFGLFNKVKRSPAIVVGATGGSGTRVVQQILEGAGVFMGSELNESRDEIHILPYLNGRLNEVLQVVGCIDYEPSDIPDALFAEHKSLIAEALSAVQADIPKGQALWGLKQPRSIMMLAFLDQLLPDFRFVHMVRDGRDIAYSKNQNQPTRHYEALFSEPYDGSASQAITMWQEVNLGAARYAEKHLAGRYHCLRYEDLCQNPKEVIQALLDFLGVSADMTPLMQYVGESPWLGRWKEQTSEEVSKLEDAASKALKQFGYSS